MGAIFGTDGIRGIVGQDLTYHMALSCGNALAKLKPNCKILIGQDTRLSGQMLAVSVALGAMLAGASVDLLGVASTPCVSYLTMVKNYDYGVVISASHNPPEYNGIKVFNSLGQKLGEEYENQLERGLVQPITTSENCCGRIKMKKQLKKLYYNYLTQGCASLAGLKIVLDCANGAGKIAANFAFSKMGAQVIMCGASSNGSKINYMCGATYPQNLSEQIKLHKADLGFAFDGDADRIIAADSTGKVYNGDNILLCLARHYSKLELLQNKVVVGTSLSNMGLEKELASIGIKLERADVGDKYVIAKMNQVGATLGGEQSGHIIIGNRLPTGDGVMVALALASIVASTNKPLKTLMSFDAMPQYMQNVQVTDKVRAMGSEALAIAIAKANTQLDGSGRVLVRPSGTEQLIRVMVECNNIKIAKKITQQIADAILMHN